LNYSFSAGKIFYDQGPGGNNWTGNNISGQSGSTMDYMTDVPTLTSTTAANYCVMNPLDNQGMTISNGNLTCTYGTASWVTCRASISMTSSKWYFECTLGTTWVYAEIGVQGTSGSLPSSGYMGGDANGFCYQSDGTTRTNSGSTGGFPTASAGDVIMCAVDIGTGKIWFGKNGTWFSSGNPATATNPAFTSLSGAYSPAVSMYSTTGSQNMSLNFGQQPFAYTPPTGFLPLNTYNI